MAKGEDNRDIFDKALDYAPIAAIAVGGAAGRRLGKRGARKTILRADKKFDDLAARQKRGEISMDEYLRQRDALQSKYGRKWADRQRRIQADQGMASGMIIGSVGGIAAQNQRNNHRKK